MARLASWERGQPQSNLYRNVSTVYAKWKALQHAVEGRDGKNCLCCCYKGKVVMTAACTAMNRRPSQEQAGSGSHSTECPLWWHHPPPYRGQCLCRGLCCQRTSPLTMLPWFAPLFPGFLLNAENPARCLGDHSSCAMPRNYASTST